VLSEARQDDLDAVVAAAWFKYRTPAYERGEFRGVPSKAFRDGFFLGMDHGIDVAVEQLRENVRPEEGK